MKTGNSPNGDIDDLLKTTLRDDLPPEAERRMRERLTAFKKTLEKPAKLREKKLKRSWKEIFRPWPAWAVRKEVLALFSVVMISAGGIFHLRGQTSVLAESVTIMNTLVCVSAELRGAGSMDCEALLSRGDEPALAYSIEWRRFPETTRLEVREGEAVVGILEVTSQGITVVDPVDKSRMDFDNVGQVHDRLYQPVMDFLSPRTLGEKLDTRWRIMGQEACGEPEETFLFADPEQGTHGEMSIDSISYLPLTMQIYSPGSSERISEHKTVLSVRFLWNRAGK